MRVILLGAPGAGKGTVAKALTKKTGSIQISTGDILRGAVNAGTPLGKKASEYMNRGDLVPDSVIMDMMEQRLQEPDVKQGFLLDGFPRTIPQAEALDALLKKLGIRLDLVANLDVPRNAILDRLTTRRTCSNSSCQEIYNVKSNPPAPDGTCKKCGSPVIQRADETIEAITKRLDVYHDKTAPLIGYYANTGMLLTIRETSTDGVADAILKAVAQKK
ncbi:MAG: adenylate kinase [Nitrospirota bacterium]